MSKLNPEPKARTEVPDGEGRRRGSVAYGMLIGAALMFLASGLHSYLVNGSDEAAPQVFSLPDVSSPPAEITAEAQPEVAEKGVDSWDGPVLYHGGDKEPIHLILVEKDLQELRLYRYDGSYELTKSYRCVTGKQRGDKSRENDDRTPEGIYFSVEAYRDSRITIFGDRAFGLNYPDVYDEIAGRGGSGIFIHGSDREQVKPFSTNGCLVLGNGDLADLDGRVDLLTTPIIIGKRLPYRFAEAETDLSETVPLLKQALLPKKYAGAVPTLGHFAILGFGEQLVAVSDVLIEPEDVQGFSRVYLADSGKGLLVLLKREWSAERPL
jgi:hypothetical protein